MRVIKLTLKVVRWLLAAVAIALIISGLGITEFRVMETITFGVLSKPLSFKIHNILWIPFLILLGLHLLYSTLLKRHLDTGENNNQEPVK